MPYNYDTLPDSSSGQYDAIAAFLQQKRQNTGAIAAMLARNFQLQGSNPANINSTIVNPIGFNSPTMFSQFAGAIDGTLGPEAGMMFQLAGQLASNPAISSMLPDSFRSGINTLLTAGPIGGVANPAHAIFAEQYRRLGRRFPNRGLPASFTNNASVDLYNEQEKAVRQYAAQITPAQAATDEYSPLENLAVGAGNEQLSKVQSFRNSLKMRKQDNSYNTAFSLFNEMQIYGPRIDEDFETSTEGVELRAVTTNQQAIDFLRKTYKGKNLNTLADTSVAKAELSTGLISAAEKLSAFTGASAVENTEMRTIGDMLTNFLDLGNNRTNFLARGSRAMAGVGALATATYDDGVNRERKNVGDSVTAAIEARIATADPTGATNPYTSVQKAGYTKTAELLGTLSASGMLSTGGVDVQGSLTKEDVGKLEKSIMMQLEGMMEVSNAGKRMGLKTQEIVQSLQSMYGGKFKEQLDLAADKALASYDKVGSTPGVTVGEEIVAKENIKRAAVDAENVRLNKNLPPTVLTTAAEQKEFLNIQAQRAAGVTTMQQLEKAVEIGRMAGVDARGVLATAATVQQIMSDVGIGGGASLAITNQAHALMVDARNAGQPITQAQAILVATENMKLATRNTQVGAAAVLMNLADRGIINKDDPTVARILADIEGGKDVSPGEIYSTVQRLTDNADKYMSENFTLSSIAAQAEKVQDFVNKSSTSQTRTTKDQLKSKGLDADGGQLNQLYKKLGVENKENPFALMMAKLMVMSDTERQDTINNVGLTDKQQRDLTAQVVAPSAVVGGDRTEAVWAQYLIEGTDKKMKAEAKVELAKMLNDSLAANSNQGGTAAALTTGIKAIRTEVKNKASARIKAANPNISAADLETQAEKESEDYKLTFEDLITASSGSLKVAQTAVLKKIEGQIDTELTTLNAAGTLTKEQGARKEKLENMKASLVDYFATTAAAATPSPVPPTGGGTIPPPGTTPPGTTPPGTTPPGTTPPGTTPPGTTPPGTTPVYPPGTVPPVLQPTPAIPGTPAAAGGPISSAAPTANVTSPELMALNGKILDELTKLNKSSTETNQAINDIQSVLMLRLI